MDMDKQHAAQEEEAGGYGTPTPEQETPGPGDRQQSTPPEEQNESTSEAGRDGSVDVPSADAEMDESNTEPTKAGRPYSSEPAGDATELPDRTSPKDDDEERFDAG